MLTCPECKTELQKNKNSYKCKKCRLKIKTLDNIIFFNPEISKAHEDYNAEGLDNLYLYEKKHFWFRIRKDIIKKVFKKFINKNNSIIEIGSGTGYIAKSIIEEGYKNYSVGDIHKNGLIYSKSYGAKNLYQFNLLKPPFVEEFEVICLFDVLEHIEDENKAIQNAYKMLKKNGKIILTVPAHQWLWSRIDEFSSHKRRYNLKTIKNLLIKNGFKILYAKHFFVLILLFLFLRTILNKKKHLIDVKKSGLEISPVLNLLLYFISKIEIILLAPFSPKIGGSIIIAGEKNNLLNKIL